MNTSELMTATWERLGSNFAFYPPGVIVEQGLNPAQLLLALAEPDLLTHRVAIFMLAEQMFLDLRERTPRLLALRRVVLGNIATEDPATSQGRFIPLRKATLRGLHSDPQWFLRRKPYPTHFCRFGLSWLIIWPRSTLTHTLTIVYKARPTALSVDTPNATPDFAETWHPLLPEIAAALLIAIQGGLEAKKAKARLVALLPKMFSETA